MSELIQDSLCCKSIGLVRNWHHVKGPGVQSVFQFILKGSVVLRSWVLPQQPWQTISSWSVFCTWDIAMLEQVWTNSLSQGHCVRQEYTVDRTPIYYKLHVHSYSIISYLLTCIWVMCGNPHRQGQNALGWASYTGVYTRTQCFHIRNSWFK